MSRRTADYFDIQFGAVFLKTIDIAVIKYYNTHRKSSFGSNHMLTKKSAARFGAKL